MFAYVRFLDKILETLDCKHIKNFDPKNIKYGKKYMMRWEKDGEYYPGELLKVANTKEELEKIITTKRICIPTKLPETEESELETEDIPIIKKNLKSSGTHKKSSETSKQHLSQNILKNFETQIASTSQSSSLVLREKEMEKEKVSKTDTLNIDKKLDYIINALAKMNKDIADIKEVVSVIQANKEAKPTEKAPQLVPDVGQLDKEKNQIHIGQSVFVDAKQYQMAYLSSKSGPQFIKRMAIVVFGTQVLSASTVYGKKSSRFPDRERKPELDPIKMRALLDVYKHYLVEKGTTDLRLHEELQNMPKYIMNKIRDLNRSSKTSNKEKNTTDVLHIQNEILLGKGLESGENGLQNDEVGADEVDKEVLSEQAENVLGDTLESDIDDEVVNLSENEN